VVGSRPIFSWVRVGEIPGGGRAGGLLADHAIHIVVKDTLVYVSGMTEGSIATPIDTSGYDVDPSW